MSNMSEEKKTFVAAVAAANETFNKNKRKLRDLSPRFWVALMDLEFITDSENWGDVKKAFKDCYRYLGAPGDFGYGTPCGDALRKVYDTWNALCKVEETRLAETAPPAAA